ncbi:MAG: hypothetical protein H6R25_997 [Proteobacteria bacterium]|nr:hypothetical protein [Pseudomonadota bacterium]
MSRSLKLLTMVIVLIAAALIWSWPYITMEFAGSAHYTEQDSREYEFYTPDILKKCHVFLPDMILILRILLAQPLMSMRSDTMIPMMQEKLTPI